MLYHALLHLCNTQCHTNVQRCLLYHTFVRDCPKPTRLPCTGRYANSVTHCMLIYAIVCLSLDDKRTVYTYEPE